MENQEHEDGDENGVVVVNNMKYHEHEIEDASDEDFPEEFLCCVCLDLFYKPVVLACGHMSCFWCVFKAMDTWQESYCPVCRHPYNYFPSVCQMLHFVLLKLYPLAYKRRERQVTEEEKLFGVFSPQFDNYLLESNSSEEFNTLTGTDRDSESKLHIGSSVKTVDPLLKDSLLVDTPDKHHITSPATSSKEDIIDVVSKEKCVDGDKLVNTCSKQVLITDFLCSLCKLLLYQPVVLNCGHVYCKACVIKPTNKLCKCPVCQSMHPNGFPKVCLVLEHFLEEQFREEYVARKLYVLEHAEGQDASPSTCSQSEKHGAQCSSEPTTSSLWLSGEEPDVHFGVGCDYCGMCPITGSRYKCTDCVEEIGFDLCEGCYNSSSKLPGRFNQQHTSDHKMIKITRRSAFFPMLQTENLDDYLEYLNNNFIHPDNQADPEAEGAVTNSSGDLSENNQQGSDFIA